MVLTPRLCAIALAAVCVWATPSLTAQDAVRNAPTTDSAALKTLTAEFTTRRTADSGSGGVLPTLEQANADSAWADAFLGRLRALQPDRLTHDEWITYAMLEHDASMQKEAAKHFWFRVPITPYASPLRGTAGSFGALPLKSDADLAAYLDALHR